MKTLEEAIDVFVRPVSELDRLELLRFPDELRPMTEKERNNAERYESLVEEIQKNKDVACLADQLILEVSLGSTPSIGEALIKAFQHGVCVGIEMEKAE